MDTNKEKIVKKEYQLTMFEDETTIAFNIGETDAYVYTCMPSVLAKLDKLCEDYPNIFKQTKFDGCGGSYKFPKKYIKISKPRNYSDLERSKRAARLELARAKK